MLQDLSLQRELDHRGYVVVDLLDEAVVGRLHHAWGGGDPQLSGLPFTATIMSPDPAYRRRTHESILREVREPFAALAPGYELLYCMFNQKQPAGPDSVVGLHLDWSLVDERRFGSVGMFCPLVDVDESNGCLFVIDGSHRIHTGPRSMRHVLPYPEHERVFLEHARPLRMRRGQVCVHALTLFHGSVPNRSPAPRLALGMLAVERGAALRHYVEHDHERFEELEVNRAFFFDLVYGAPPPAAPSLGLVPIHATPPLTEPELRRRIVAGLA